MHKHLLITGGAGFIGSHLSEMLIKEGHRVTIIDNFDPYYNRSVKEKNIEWLCKQETFELLEIDILELAKLRLHLVSKYDAIIHIAAKAGVHYSVKNPTRCQEVNVIGTQNMLEIARELEIKQFVFASSSSVYGVNPNYPWSEKDQLMMPISPYASSKLSCELLGHVYTQLYGIRFLGLRFFTVYGPRQRPDLAIHKFANLIIEGKEVPRYGDGSTERDYTYVSDVVGLVRKAIDYDKSMFEVINVGSNRTISLNEMIAVIEEVFEKKAKIKQLPAQPGDVPITYADITKAASIFDYEPKVSFRSGIANLKLWMEGSS